MAKKEIDKLEKELQEKFDLGKFNDLAFKLAMPPKEKEPTVTFPIVEIFCPKCKERMSLINNPKFENYIVEGYGQIIDYYYQCNSTERHSNMWHVNGKIIGKAGEISHVPKGATLGTDNWCSISNEGNIIIIKILIPKLESENRGVSTTASNTSYNIEEICKHVFGDKPDNRDICLVCGERKKAQKDV
ncbi:hypothetical protein LCGC14_1413150 [marine sediment metagenome]|uniref:Uncharacterized protein n=1 Tax=marine sediment metagenome TaxID=412755 RepID=A0A0F9MVB1_9ZZZZ